MITRRNFLTGAAALAGGSSALRQLAAAATPGAQAPRANSAAATDQDHADQKSWPPGQPGVDYQPVITPNGSTLPWKEVDGVKVTTLSRRKWTTSSLPA